MNLQQVRQPESSTNEYGSQEVERETVSKLEQKLESSNAKQSRPTTKGIVLKMARLIGTGSSQEQNSIADSISKVRARTLIIPAEELVQITAKGVSVTKDGFANDSRHSPDEDDHQCT
ncbi:hypothetical protein Acr_11g0014910 [Actinidia rufa]|uniref:Uncharacterized protein n=1 Tax=Actinidia rufa TaxID=165716 RepID=A0A7J0FEU2_9ERIC|nr:hypothetical protein Acr_11g0014910 [Actinidia rufa]